MTKKQVEEEKGGEGGGEKCDSGEVEEEMEEVKEGGAGWRGSGIRDKWMSSHEIAPLASHLLSSGGVSSLSLASLCVLTLLGGVTYPSHIQNNKYCTFAFAWSIASLGPERYSYTLSARFLYCSHSYCTYTYVSFVTKRRYLPLCV